MIMDQILVIDLGGTQAYYTARQLRGERFYCQVLPAGTTPEEIRALNPRGVVYAGGEPDEDSAGFPVDPEELDIPLLALGAAARLLAKRLGCTSRGTHMKDKDYIQFSSCELFDSLSGCERSFDRVDVYSFPPGVSSIAETATGISCGFSMPRKNIYGLQFYVEPNDPEGLAILTNFAGQVCSCPREWSCEQYAPQIIENAREAAGGSNVLLPVSGGFESAVAAAVLKAAIGSRLKCIFIDTGFMRKGDPDLVRMIYTEKMGLDLITVDASEQFARVLENAENGEEKRRIFHEEYSTVFAEQFLRLSGMDAIADSTTYSAILKNQKPMFTCMIEGCKIVSPLDRLFKDEVHALGSWLDVPVGLMNQPPFEFCGLAVRCLGRITPERIRILREADAIFSEVVEVSKYARRIAQAFVILTGIKAPGANGNGYVCVLRAMGPSSAGHADAKRLPLEVMDEAVRQITGTLPEITHVVYDITDRPIGSVEWE